MAKLDASGDFCSYNVFDSANANENEAALFVFINSFFVRLLTSDLFWVDYFVGNAYCSERLSCHQFYVVKSVLLERIANGSNVAGLEVNVFVTGFENVFGSTFEIAYVS